jgi:hypothetical protein
MSESSHREVIEQAQRPLGLTAMKLHLLFISGGTVHHLRGEHGLPVDLIDAEDTYGLIVDHAWLHGYEFTENGALRKRTDD